LVQVDLHPAAALEIARQNRRDWMNARASLVDAWRLIEFVADDLESTLDLEINGEMKNTGDNPFNFDADTGRLNARIRFDAPLNRFSERNAYRQKLIEYQQARRNYYALEDQIARGLRNTIRTLQASRRNFEIRREAVRAADLQIELNEDIRLIQEANRQPSGPTAARDAVSALSDLLTAQNDFLSVWVTYEVLRRTLDFDLGTMQLDTRGMWIDPGTIGPETGYPGIADENADCWPGAMTSPEVQPQCTPCEMIEPGMIEPGMIEPGMIEPGMIGPGRMGLFNDF
jgi:outer membrane protein TolC